MEICIQVFLQGAVSVHNSKYWIIFIELVTSGVIITPVFDSLVSQLFKSFFSHKEMEKLEGLFKYKGCIHCDLWTTILQQ